MTVEAEEGEERVYGDATPVIVEWRNARDAFHELLKTGIDLEQREAKRRMLRLEIAIIEEHELTLLPASYPWGREDRLGQARRRGRALLRRWARRILTRGLWRH